MNLYYIMAEMVLDMSSMYIVHVAPTQMQQPLTANKFGEKTSTCYTCGISRIPLLDSFAPTASQFPKEPLQEGPCFDPNMHNDWGGAKGLQACRTTQREGGEIESERGRCGLGMGVVRRPSSAAPALNYEEPPSQGAKCMF